MGSIKQISIKFGRKQEHLQLYLKMVKVDYDLVFEIGFDFSFLRFPSL